MTYHSHLARRHELAMILTATVVMCFTVQAHDAGKVDLEAAESQAAQLVGTRVFAGDTEIGAVSDVSTGEDGLIDKVRVRAPSPLGFGERIVEIPASAFTVLRGVVVLELTPEEVDQFPTAQIESNTIQSEDRD